MIPPSSGNGCVSGGKAGREGVRSDGSADISQYQFRIFLGMARSGRNRIITAADPAGSIKRCGTVGGTLWDRGSFFSTDMRRIPRPIEYAVREIQDETDVKVAWMFYPGWQQVHKEYMESPTWGGMFHACEFETSLMLAAREELVHMERAVQEYPERPPLYGMDNTSIGDLSKSGTYWKSAGGHKGKRQKK